MFINNLPLSFNNKILLSNQYEMLYQKTIYQITTNDCSADKTTGYDGDIITIINNPAEWNERFSGFSITGSTLTGNTFKIIGNDVTVQANYETAKNITTNNCSADKTSGFIGDIITIDNDPPAWNERFSGFSITGSTLTGNTFMLTGSDVTVKADYETAKNVVTSTDGHGTITATPMSGFTGTTISLSNTPNTNYVFKNYTVTGATLTGNQFKLTGSNVTARANFSAIPQYTAKNVQGYLMSVNPSAWAYTESNVYETVHPDYDTIMNFNSTAVSKNFYLMPTDRGFDTFKNNSGLFAGFKNNMAQGTYPYLSGRYLNTTAYVSSIDVTAQPWLCLNGTATASKTVSIYMAINNGTPHDSYYGQTITLSPGQTKYQNAMQWKITFNPAITVTSGTRVNLKITTNVKDGSISANFKQLYAAWGGTISGLET